MTTALTCPVCDSATISIKSETDTFVYRSGGIDYPVVAKYPLHICDSCGESFLTEEGENARHEAVCAAMNRLTPREVVLLRSRLKLSRKAFAELSGVGEASLARWESGELIQSESNDNLLRLLAIDENVRMVQEIRGATGKPRDPRQEVTQTRSAIMSDRAMIVVLERLTALTREDAERANRQSPHFRIKRAAGLH